MTDRLPTPRLSGFSYPAGTLLSVNLSLGHGATTRLCRVEWLSQHGDALTLVDVTGAELTGEIVSLRAMTPAEQADWFAFLDHPCDADNQPLNCWQLGPSPFGARRPLARCVPDVVETVGEELAVAS